MKTSYIDIVLQPRSAIRKTDTWAVLAKDGAVLGTISWYGGWRKYCFYPASLTIFEETCMRELADFIVAKTKEYKKQKAPVA